MLLFLHIVILLVRFYGCFKKLTGVSIIQDGNTLQWSISWEGSSWSWFLLWSFSWLWLYLLCFTLVRNPHWTLSHRSWDRHSSLNSNFKKPQSINSKTVDFMTEKKAIWLLAFYQWFPWLRKSTWHTCKTKYKIIMQLFCLKSEFVLYIEQKVLQSLFIYFLLNVMQCDSAWAVYSINAWAFIWNL